MRDLLISIENYQRISETIYSVLEYVGFPPENNCVFFSLIGAVILEKHFGIECKSYSGAAYYYINEEKEISLGFAEQIGEARYIGSINGFHSWNENETHVIDFQAPLFQEMAINKYVVNACARKMFQRKISQQCMSPGEFKHEGDFFHSPNPVLGNELVDMFLEDPLKLDLINICSRWFKNPISSMKEFCEIKDENGTKATIKLKKLNLEGSW